MFPSTPLCTVLPDAPPGNREQWTLTSEVLTETVDEREIELTFAEFDADGIPFTLRYQPEVAW
jgi:hypothetical protein